MSNSGMHRTPTPSEAGGPTRPRLDNNSASKVAKPDFYYGDRYKLKERPLLEESSGSEDLEEEEEGESILMYFTIIGY
ncbi:hypothetical protein M433DRAFT_8718 [Acidomyces richmondensis BFW]|nr:hypothetical protein M433DRAFT_8718 [Acidomyces richmondensis BFW]